MGTLFLKLVTLAAAAALLYWYTSTVVAVLATVLIVALPLGMAGVLIKALAFFLIPTKR